LTCISSSVDFFQYLFRRFRPYNQLAIWKKCGLKYLSTLSVDKIFEDKCSGKDVIRPQLTELLEWVRRGDTIHVHSIDRLARNLKDLQNLVEEITGKGVTLHFHKANLVFSGDDTSTQKLMLQLMGAFAEFERSLIRERQREG
jgi:DNA invertase Pin-like site-specific DNA recombinase